MTQTSNKPKTVAVVGGALLALAGAAIAAVGGILLGLFGGDGTVASSSHPLSTSRTALVTSVTEIDDVASLADVAGDPRIRVSVRSAKPGVFVGVGPAAAVDRYLAGAAIDEVTDLELDPFELKRRPRGGTTRPSRPAQQRFWVARATGARAATLRWKVRDGDYRFVLMNADSTRGVETDADVGLTVPHMPAIAWSLIGGGLLLLTGGAATIVVAARRGR